MAKRKAKTSKQAPGKKTAMDVLVTYMKRSPKAVYADAQAACEKAGHKIYPIMWGRAQVMLGRVTARAKGARKTRGPAAVSRVSNVSGISTVRRGPGRPRKVQPASGIILPINGPADLANWQQVVAGLNGGRKVSLQYDGENWLLAIL